MLFPSKNISLKAITTLETEEGYSARRIQDIITLHNLPYQIIIDKKFYNGNCGRGIWRCTFVTPEIELRIKKIYGKPNLGSCARNTWKEGCL